MGQSQDIGVSMRGAASSDADETIAHRNAGIQEAASLSVKRLADFKAAEEFISRLENPVGLLPYHTPAWMKAYASTLGSERAAVLASLWLGDQPAALLPLEQVSRGQVSWLRFLGQDRGNQFTGVWDRTALEKISPSDLSNQLLDLGRSINADMIQLANTPERLDGLPLPFALCRRVASPSPVYQGKLSDDFDSLFRSAVKKDSRKKLLKKQKALEAAGEYEIVRAQTDEQIARGLATFILQRTSRAAQTGIPNVFCDGENTAFLEQLLKPSEDDAQPCLELWWLECGGKIRATYLCARSEGTLYGYSNSIAHDEMMAHSPGVVLLKEIIAISCADPAMTDIDLGLGDERYKHAWAQPVPLCEHLKAVTFKGRVAALAQRTRQDIKGRIRSSRTLWQLVRRLRKVLAQKG
ncbi:GNAT family N-acetyltransferase [Roseibium sp.]|uniref:GNAT family N-acetyltransferase n=1 Tax=Roseibium sp. TaxID=1936156 RepID=UPI003A970777